MNASPHTLTLPSPIVSARAAGDRMATVSRIAAAIAAAGFSFLIASVWLAPDMLTNLPGYAALLRSQAQVTMGPGASLVLTLVLLCHAALAVGALVALACSFAAMARDEPLNEEAVSWLRRAGLLVLTGVVASILLQVPASAALTWSNLPGMRTIAISLGSGQLAGAIGGGALLALSRILHWAVVVRCDHREII